MQPTREMSAAYAGWAVRAAVLAAAVAGCAGPIKPATMVDLTALPPEQTRRNEYLATTEVRPGPETRQPLPDKAQQVETAAATAAAILGAIFSTSSNVLLGASAPVEENRLFDPHMDDRERLPRSEGNDEGSEGAAGAEPGTEGAAGAEPGSEPESDPSRLVPWVELPSRAP